MLKPETARLWERLKSEPLLAGSVLVGGTALAMHLNHRLSEDLDFMFPVPRLPAARLDALRRRAAAEGLHFVANDRPADLAEFEDTGLDFHDFQRSYLVGGAVKLSFVAPDPELLPLLNATSKSGPRVATLEEIFRLKCIACANRSKSRDWLDMYVMLERGLFQPLDIYQSFERAGVPQKFDIAMMRMTSGKLALDDEGYEAMLESPPSLAQMKARFERDRDEIEIGVAKLRLEQRGRRPGPTSPP